MEQIISSCDILSFSPVFYFKGKSRVSSLMGGLLTLIFYGICLTILILSSSDLLFKTFPLITIERVYDTSAYVIDSSQTQIWVSIYDEKRNEYLDSASSEFDFRGKIIDSNNESTALSYLNCNPNTILDYEEIKEVTRAICLFSGTTQMEASHDYKRSTRIQFVIDKSAGDMTEAELASKLQSYHIKILFIEQLPTITSFEEPYQQKPKVASFDFGPNTKHLLRMRRVTVLSDEGMLFESLKTSNYLDLLINGSIPGSNLFELEINLEETSEIITRKYKKVGEVFSHAVGLCLPVFMLFKIIVSIYSKSYYFNCLYSDYCSSKNNKNFDLERIAKEGLVDYSDGDAKTKMHLKLNERTFTNTSQIKSNFEKSRESKRTARFDDNLLGDKSARRLITRRESLAEAADDMVELRLKQISKQDFAELVKKLSDPSCILALFIEVKLIRCLTMNFYENSIFDLLLKNKASVSSLLNCKFSSTDAAHYADRIVKQIKSGENMTPINYKLAKYFERLIH